MQLKTSDVLFIYTAILIIHKTFMYWEKLESHNIACLNISSFLYYQDVRFVH